jgi:hypothetical protein
MGQGMVDGGEPIGNHASGHDVSCNKALLLTLRDEPVFSPKHEAEDRAQYKRAKGKNDPFSEKCLRSVAGRGHIQNPSCNAA